MAKDFDSMEDSNRSGNAPWHAVSDPARRVWLQGGLGTALAAAFGPLAAGLSGCATAQGGGQKLGFQSVPPTRGAQVVAPWGDPWAVAGNMPAWRPDASNSAADQAVQMGMHHDGIHFYPPGTARSRAACW
jgi:secreted PhoX family phosphatase